MRVLAYILAVGGKDRLAVCWKRIGARREWKKFTELGARSTLKEWNLLGTLTGENGKKRDKPRTTMRRLDL
jgi:hypothetical protein